MQKNFTTFCLLLFSLLMVFCGCQKSNSVSDHILDETRMEIHRIISTTPSITEVLFDVGLGDKLVGDSIFTTFPPESLKIEKIGGLYDVNLEKIVSLRPDIVILLSEQINLRESLSRLGIETLLVDHQKIETLVESYQTIGSKFGGETAIRAKERQTTLKNNLDKAGVVGQNSIGKTKTRHPSVLICVDRSRHSGRIENLFLAGTNTFYDEVIRAAGGTNVLADENFAPLIKSPFPSVSAEGVLALAPDIIIEIYTGDGKTPTKSWSESEKMAFQKKVVEEWRQIGTGISAVRNSLVFVWTDDYASIPGPRTPKLIHQMRDIIEQAASD
ncbi:MAG: ABC transporter substrate-binding protein [Thermoguttaceae bacterium]